MKLFLIGCIIGIGKVLPGVSGSILAIRLHVYEEGIEAIVNFFKDKKNNFLFLSKLGIGFVLMMIISSKALFVLINRYEFILKLVFTLLIVSGLPDLIKKSGSYIVTIIAFLSVLIILFIPYTDTGPNFFLMGVIEAFSIIIPGISGTAIYLVLGWYDDILQFLGNLYMFDFAKIIPFAFGLSIGGIVFIKIMSFLFDRYREESYSAILGFLLASIVLIFA